MSRRLSTALVIVLLIGLATPAAAYYEKTVDPGPFPDTCDIRGTNYYSVWYRAKTVEQANCARIEAELRYKDTSGIWRFRQTGYVYASVADTGWFRGQNGDYTDHNGDNDAGGVTYGFRIHTPGA